MMDFLTNVYEKREQNKTGKLSDLKFGDDTPKFIAKPDFILFPFLSSP